MAFAKFNKAQVAGLVSVIPPVRKTIDAEVENYGGNAAQIKRIKRTIGLNQRYVVEPGMTTVDLCELSCHQIFQHTSLSPEEIDAIFCVTQTPDYFQPCNANVLHGRLGLSRNCAAFDVNLGCSGFVYGLWLAYMMVESNSCRNVLLLAGDTVSLNCHPRDRAVALLFGDAGSATLINASPTPTPSYFSLHSDGQGFNHIIVPAGGFRQPKDATTALEVVDSEGNVRSPENLYMNGAEIFNFSIKEEPTAIREILAFAGASIESIDYIFFHQANKYIISNIVRRLKISLKKAPCAVVERFGNQSSASIPVTICDSLLGKASSASYKVILSGFGVGLSWATALLSLKHLQCCELVFYPPKG